MEGRSWPWKKKSSDKDKKVGVNDSTTLASSLSSLASLETQDKCKNTSYVQITMDSYTHMSKMEDQVKLFETEVKDLKEKLNVAHSEIKTKECVILQHAKVAEEAVSGWEKADAQTLSLKRQLESVTLLKLTAEERASHLDDALKECTRQIRIVKEESEHKLQDMILSKTTHWENIKSELERKIDELASDNASLTRTSQERTEMIVRLREEKSKAEGEVEKLKTNVELAEKEISSLKYNVHVASKEVEIRNEEKDMSLKSAENANKQYLESVKKISKFEVECQRLRGLLRKKLPGPGAISQMKIEVENIGNIAMEEEIQRLKELLDARNNELKVSRNVCGKTLEKVKMLEEQLNNDSSPSVVSVSEDGFDEGGSSSSTDSRKGSSLKPNRLELMDDFLEIEKLAASSASKSSSSSSSSSEEDENATTLDQFLNVIRSRMDKIVKSQEGLNTERIVEAVRISIQGSFRKLSSPLFEVTDETLVPSQDSRKTENEERNMDETAVSIDGYDISQCLQNLESTKAVLGEKEKIITELKSKLTSSNDLQSLAETQLKCVTESCKSLEVYVKDLEEERKRLEMALSAEKLSHEETLAKCKDLQERVRKCSSSKLQHNQEKDIANATEKLAACQETIHLLSQQLQSLQLQEHKSVEASAKYALDDHILKPSHSFRHTVNPTVHDIIKSSSVSSSSSKEDNEKYMRGFGRFFASKMKNNSR